MFYQKLRIVGEKFITFGKNPRHTVKTRLTLKPGQHGTKTLMKRYGDDLVCVRFRYDPESRSEGAKFVAYFLEEFAAKFHQKAINLRCRMITAEDGG